MEVPRASEGSGGHASIQEFRVHSSSSSMDSPSPRLFKFRVFSSSSSFEFEFGELGGADLAFEFELAALAELELELFSRLRPCALHRHNGSIDDDQRCGGSCSASRSMRQVRWRKGGGYGVPCSPVLGVGVAGRGCRPRSSRRQPPAPHARDVRDTDARALVDALGVPRVEFGAACAAANDACMRTACLVSGVRVAVGGARPRVRASAGAVAAACARRVRRRHRAGGVRLRRGGPAFACGPRARRPPPTAAVVVAVVLAFVDSPSRRRRAARRRQRLWVRRGVVVSNRLSLTESSRILS